MKSRARTSIVVLLTFVFIAVAFQSVLTRNAGAQAEEKSMEVPYFHQGQTGWCFYASLAMTMEFYGKDRHPWEVASDWNVGHDEGYRPDFLAPLLDWILPGELSNYLSIYDLDADWLPASSPFSTYKARLDSEQPLIIAGKGHAVVVVGYRTDDTGDYLYVHDPSGYFVRDEWKLVSWSPAYMNVEVSWNFYTDYFLWSLLSVITIHSTVGAPPDPPQGVLYVNDLSAPPISHTTVSHNSGWQYIGNEFAWNNKPVEDTNGDGFINENDFTSENNGNGQEILQGENIVLRYYVSNHHSSTKCYQADLDLRDENNNLVYTDKKVFDGPDCVPARSVTYSIFVVPKSILSSLDPGKYKILLGLWEPNPNYSPGSQYDQIGPFGLSLATNFGRNKGVTLFSNVEVMCVGCFLLGWKVDVFSDFNAYSKVVGTSWSWTFYADTYMRHLDDQKWYLDTGLTRLEYQLSVRDQDGNVLDSTGWMSTDMDHDGVFGDFSHLGGRTSFMASPSLTGPIPSKVVFLTKWRLGGVSESAWIESVELIPVMPKIPFIQMMEVEPLGPEMGGQYQLTFTVRNPTNSDTYVSMKLEETGARLDIGDIPYGPETRGGLVPALGSKEIVFDDVEHEWFWLDPALHMLSGAPFTSIFGLGAGLGEYFEKSIPILKAEYPIVETSVNSLMAKVPSLTKLSDMWGKWGPLLNEVGTIESLWEILMVVLEATQTVPSIVYTYQVTSVDLSESFTYSVQVNVPLDKQNAFWAYFWMTIVSNVLGLVASHAKYAGPVGVVLAGLAWMGEAVLAATSDNFYKEAEDPFLDYKDESEPRCYDDIVDFPELQTAPNIPPKDLDYDLLELECDSRGLYVFSERYRRARDSNDQIWMDTHIGWMSRYTARVHDDFLDMGTSAQQTLEYLDTIGISLDQSAIDVEKQRIGQHGLDAEVRNYLGRVGLAGEIDAIGDAIVSLPDDYYLRYRSLLEEIEDLAVLYEVLGEYLGGNLLGKQYVLPVADAGSDIVAWEGDLVQLDGLSSMTYDGEIIGYEWTFDGHVLSGERPTFIWFDNGVIVVTLTITYLITYYESVDGGDPVLRTEIGISTDTVVVTILNKDPVPLIVRSYVRVNFTLRAAGEKFHDVEWSLYKREPGSDTWRGIRHLSVTRQPGSPDEQSTTASDVWLFMENMYKFEATYDPYDDPINGQLPGSTPVWVDLEFLTDVAFGESRESSTERIHHNFNIQQSTLRDTDRWVHCEAWCVDLSPWLVGHWITFEASASDIGTDDLDLSWDFDDGSSDHNESFHPFRDRYNPYGPDDPEFSPYDRDEAPYPMEITITVYHKYLFEGDFNNVTLTSTDDDGGLASGIFDIDAIHSEHVCNVR